MFRTLTDVLFRCFHRQLSRPITMPHNGTYVVCLDCGRRFPYDLQAMRITKSAPAPLLAEECCQ